MHSLDRAGQFDYTVTTLPKWRNWQTRATQNRVPTGMRVRFPPSAQEREDYSTGMICFMPVPNAKIGPYGPIFLFYPGMLAQICKDTVNGFPNLAGRTIIILFLEVKLAHNE